MATRFSPIVYNVLLPPFFALSGINTNISGLKTGVAWGFVVATIVIAFIGKVAGGFIAAKCCRIKTRESLTIGVLLSCKGIVELIALVSEKLPLPRRAGADGLLEHRTASRHHLAGNLHDLCRDGSDLDWCDTATGTMAVSSVIARFERPDLLREVRAGSSSKQSKLVHARASTSTTCDSREAWHDCWSKRDLLRGFCQLHYMYI